MSRRRPRPDRVYVEVRRLGPLSWEARWQTWTAQGFTRRGAERRLRHERGLK